MMISANNVEVLLPLGRGRVVRAVDGVSLDIVRGETLGVTGESGCGKTTLGRALAGLVEPTRGSIEAAPGLRRQMIFQDSASALDPRMTVAAIIAEPLRSTARVHELMELVGLDAGFGGRYPHELSGGQRQRVGIARALGGEPDFIVADEPIARLDASIQALILNLLKELQEKAGLTYLFISHDLRAVHHLADRMAVMYMGKIVEIGPAPEVYARPMMPYSQALISAVDLVRPRMVLQGEIPSPIDPPSGCRFRTRCPIAMPVCAEVEPALREVSPGHLAACHAIEITK